MSQPGVVKEVTRECSKAQAGRQAEANKQTE